MSAKFQSFPCPPSRTAHIQLTALVDFAASGAVAYSVLLMAHGASRELIDHAQAVALTYCEAYIVSRASFSELAKEFPEVWKKVEILIRRKLVARSLLRFVHQLQNRTAGAPVRWTPKSFVPASVSNGADWVNENSAMEQKIDNLTEMLSHQASLDGVHGHSSASTLSLQTVSKGGLAEVVSDARKAPHSPVNGRQQEHAEQALASLKQEAKRLAAVLSNMAATAQIIAGTASAPANASYQDAAVTTAHGSHIGSFDDPMAA